MDIKQSAIIPDEPADQDQFFGAGHQRSANALGYAVEQLAERDGAIGLEGPWGAGKSTVINLAAQEFAKSKSGSLKHHFFTFDLWVHHPEMLKLAFLEEFIAWAHTNKFLTNKQEKEFGERVTDREITTRIQNKRQFSYNGILFVLLFPLLPLAYAWLSPFAFAPNTSTMPNLLSIKGIGLNANELAITSLVGLYVVFAWSTIWGLGTKKVSGLKAALSAAARMFSRETDYDKITQSVRERNPTNEEFQTFFREILSVVQKDNDRIVFIFDNIDRLPNRSVPKVWSEARSIFAMQSRGKVWPNSHVTAIVPYDATYIAEAFENGSNSEPPTGERAQHLIRKTFDITVRVAPPLSTDWKKFLEAKLDEAFSEPLSDSEKYKLFKLFDIDLQENGSLPTPRNIISYINSVGAIWNQWGDEIDVTHMALYVLVRNTIESNNKQLKNGTCVNPRQARVLEDSAYLKNLAALHFNVQPEHAYQVLLGQDIERLAISSNTDEFVELSKSPGFIEVFPDVVLMRVEQWAKDGADYVAKLAQNMAHPEVAGEYLHEAWRHMAEAVSFFNGCDTSAPEEYEGLAELVAHLGDAEASQCATKVLDWFTRNLPKAEERSAEDGDTWLNFFAAIHQGLAQASGDQAAQALVAQTKCPNGPPFTLGVCAACTEHTTIDFNKFGRSEKEASLKAAALNLVETNVPQLAAALLSKPKFATDTVFSELTDKLCERIQTEKLASEDLAHVVDLLARTRTTYARNDTTKNRIAQTANDGSLVWHADKAHQANDIKTVGAIIWLIVDVCDMQVPGNPSNHRHFGDVNPSYQEYEKLISSLSKDDEITGKISDLVVSARVLAEWMRFAIDAAKPEFFRIVFSRTIEDGTFNKLSVSETVTSFDRLKAVLSDELLNSFLVKFTDWSRHFKDQFKGEGALEIPPTLIRAIAETKIEGYEDLISCLDDYFQSLSEEDWLTLLSGQNNQALDLLLVRLETSEYKPPLASFSGALMKHALSLLDGDLSVPEQYLSAWPKLFDGIQKNTQDKFSRDIMLNLKNLTTTPAAVAQFLEVYASVSAILPLTEFADTTLDQLVTPALGSQTAVVSDFFEKRSGDLKKCAMGASSDVLGRLNEALLDVRGLEDEEENLKERYAKYIGIELPKPKPVELPPDTSAK